MDDEGLVSAARAGDQAAFAALVGRYRAYVYTIAYKILLHEDDALDVTQVVFMRVAQKIGSYSGKGTFRGWLAAIAAREAISERRRSARREQPMDPEVLANVVEDAITPQTAIHLNSAGADPRVRIEQEWKRRRVDAAMRSLSPQQRAILALQLREEMRTVEIAQHLGIGESQVRSQQARAVQRLREMLSDGNESSDCRRGEVNCEG